MKKLLLMLAFVLPFIAFTSCSKDDVTSASQLSGTKWEGNVGFGDLILATFEVEFHETTFTATARTDFNGDGVITDDEYESSTGTYTIDGNYIYMTAEGETIKAELRDGKIYLKVTEENGEDLPMEFVLTQK